jgi:hypothetical protein
MNLLRVIFWTAGLAYCGSFLFAGRGVQSLHDASVSGALIGAVWTALRFYAHSPGSAQTRLRRTFFIAPHFTEVADRAFPSENRCSHAKLSC